MSDIVCFGEILMDMTPQTGREGTLYQPNPGGAPANVAVAVSRLGGSAAFIGSVGDDFFGGLLRHTLTSNGVDTRCLKTTSRAPTTLAFVHLDREGERSFSFYRQPGADLFLPWGREERSLIASSRLFHFGSLSMTTPRARHITRQALAYAHKTRKIISYDPNLRPALWKNLSEARKVILSPLRYVHILKVSEEELLFLSRTTFQEAWKWLASLRLPLVLVTRGKEGVTCLYQKTMFSTSSYEVNVVDTTGAGDAFVGAFLSGLVKEPRPLEVSREKLLSLLKYASAVAAITISRPGAIPALPSRQEVEQFLRNYDGSSGDSP